LPDTGIIHHRRFVAEIIEPELKEALRAAAEREHRSIADMVAVPIMDYREKNGIEVGAIEGKSRNDAAQ